MADFPPCDDVCGAVDEHVRRFFRGHQVGAFTWSAGPILSVNPHFRALRVAPAEPGGLWEYVSVGGWAASGQGRGLEFVISVPAETPRAVELLAMTVYYNITHPLGLGHIIPIGEPWLPGSACDRLLVSLPYPHGPRLQTCHRGDLHVDVLWLLPITVAERDFIVENGQEALESRFDEARLQYWDIHRRSVV
jgi:hypothetical protein